MRFIIYILVLSGLTAITLLENACQVNTKPELTSGSKAPMVYCAPSFDPAKLEDDKAPLLTGLGNIHYEATTKSTQAQKYFDQGLALLYGFNHGEAGRSFKAAIRLDSTMSMAYWGMAMVLGPNYNASLNPTSLKDINEAMDKALKYSATATEKEQLLVKAMAIRFPRTETKDMMPFYENYAAEMKKVHERFADDIEIAVLYADAMMNLHPWNLWLKDGTPQPWTPALIQLLETTLNKAPDHPGAEHYYIHAIEASKQASKALPYAKKLETAMPAVGHMVHMPSHIYIRTGNYHDGVLVNEQASEADSTYVTQCKAQGLYALMLYPHNIHFLAACAFLEGNSKKAIDAAWSVSRQADKKYLVENAGVQHFYVIPYYVMIHLGKWDDILSQKKPDVKLPYAVAIWHYARGMAFAGKGEIASANSELKILQKFATDESLRAFLIWEMNSVLDLINIASYTLEAELLSINKKIDEAVVLFKKATAIEDQLLYTEPPDWFFSVRHSWGHWLVQNKRFEEAEKIYKEDLNTFPESGWSLIGLYNSLKGQGKEDSATAVYKQFQTAWQWADFKIESSRVRR